jgi:hypothetical protein
MKGRWAAGIIPRNFAWIIKGHLAVSERPGGSAPDHRRVRRQEEIFWLRAQGFTRIVSLLPSTHNLHAYEELGLECAHVPMGMYADIPTVLGELYPKLLGWLHAGDRILVHQDELGDRIAGVFAGFLWWSGMIPEPPLAISAIEHLLRRQLGAAGRTIATLALEIPPPPEEDRRHPAPPPEETVVELRPEGAETPAPARPVVSGGGEPAAPGGDARETPDDTVAPVADISVRRSTVRSRRRKPAATEPQPVSPLKSTRTASHPTGDTASDPPAGATREPSRPPAPRTSRAANRKLPPQKAKSEVPKPAPKAVKAAPRPPVPRVQGTSRGATTRGPKGPSDSRPVPPHRHLGER